MDYWKNKIHPESVSAIFIIAFVSLFILAGFAVGFSLPLYIVAMILGGAITFLYPRSGFYAIIFLTFIFERFFTLQSVFIGRTEYKIYPLDIIFGAVILGTLLQILIKKIKTNFKKNDLLLILFIGLAGIYFVLSVFALGNDFSLSFSSLKNYGFYSLFYFLILLLFDAKEHLMRFLKFAFAGAVGIIPFEIYGILTGHGLWSEFTPLSTEGVRTLAFTHAFYLSLSLIFVLAYVAFKKGRLSKLFLFLAPVWAVGIIGSMMRHLWLSILAAVVFLFFTLPKRNKIALGKLIFIKYALAIVFLAVLLFYLSFLLPYSSFNKGFSEISGVLSNRIHSIASTSDESIAWRNVVWNEAFEKYAQNPILGLGFGDKIFIEMGKYRDYVEVRNIHNSLLAVLFQMGLVGFAVFIFLISRLFKNIYQKQFSDIDLNFIKFSTLGIFVFQLTAFLFQPYLEANLLGIFFWINLGFMRKLYENFGD